MSKNFKKNKLFNRGSIIFELINVTKVYKTDSNEFKVLDNINLSFPPSGLVSILGKSGCGKSTLLNLLSGIDKPTSGIIKYKNKDINKLNNKELKYFQNNEIGILFQHFNLFDSLSCLENIIVPSLINGVKRKDAIKKAEELLSQFNILYLKDRKYYTLSGGEKQRIALIRCLINNPGVIIADEPTGALDTNNSILIMDALKLVSKNKLVILVTHNEMLSSEYNDYLIDFNKEIKLTNNVDKNLNFKSKTKIINFSIIWSFISIHLKKHFIRNTIVSISITFSSLCFLLSFGYINGSNKSRETYTTKSMLYSCASISKKKIIDVPSSPIKISKLSRPDLIELEFLNVNIPSISIKNNYQIYFPSYPIFSYHEIESSNINFSPYYNSESRLLKIGRFPKEDSFNEVVVNEEFINNFKIKSDGVLDSYIKLDFTSSIYNSFERRKIKDEINFNNSLRIVGIVSEFSYLNEPRVYYPYKGLEIYLKGIELENYSKEIGSSINASEAIDYAESTDINSSYSYLLFIEDLCEVNKLKKYKKEFDITNEFEITSINFTISESYNSLVDIISSSLYIFLVLISLATILIIVISSYSSYIQNKKESAILSILGLRRNSLFFIYNFENLIVMLFGFIMSCLLFVPVKNLVNNLIYNFSRLDKVITINIFSKISLFLIIGLIFITTISSLIPFLIYDKNYIIQELKDE